MKNWRVCVLFLKRIFQWLCNLRFPGHIGLGVKTGTEEQKQTVILWVSFLYRGPAPSHACESRSLGFSALTAQLISESCNDQEAAGLVSCSQTPTAGLCSALSHAVRCSQGPEVVKDTPLYLLSKYSDFPGGASAKEPACQCKRHKRRGFCPWVGKNPWRRAWQPTPVFLPREPMDRGACWAPVRRVEKSWTRLKQLNTLSAQTNKYPGDWWRKRGKSFYWMVANPFPWAPSLISLSLFPRKTGDRCSTVFKIATPRFVSDLGISLHTSDIYPSKVWSLLQVVCETPS